MVIAEVRVGLDHFKFHMCLEWYLYMLILMLNGV
jgi:hypothetical protein